MAARGATTVWELWNGDSADPGMNSGNHVMLVGDLVIWLYEYVAGIRPDPARPGFKHILMRPTPVGDLTHARGTHNSPYGLIVSEWKKGKEAFEWAIAVPANSSATVYVPAQSPEHVTEGGKAARHAEGVTFLRQEPGYALFEVGAGTYRFRSAPGK
jgi:alpha-L-rhamnosidase